MWRAATRSSRLAAAAGCASASATAAYCSWWRREEAPQPEPAQISPVLLSYLLQPISRCRELLRDPPAPFVRFEPAWRNFTSDADHAALESSRVALAVRAAATEAAVRQQGRWPEEEGKALEQAAKDTVATIETIGQRAVAAAAAVPWPRLLRGVALEAWRSGERRDAASLRGVVGVYVTAGWCGPCRRFTPDLIAFHEATRGAERAFEVVHVSWDNDEASFRHYAAATGMGWLALPYDEREAAATLSLRYGVPHIPTLIVLDIADDGEARVVSENGRRDVEQWRRTRVEAPWMRGCVK
jgi:nucleoredoxin